MTHGHKSRDHINMEHAHSRYSLSKRDSIHRRRVKSVIRPRLYPQAGFISTLVCFRFVSFRPVSKVSNMFTPRMPDNMQQSSRISNRENLHNFFNTFLKLFILGVDKRAMGQSREPSVMADIVLVT